MKVTPLSSNEPADVPEACDSCGAWPELVTNKELSDDGNHKTIKQWSIKHEESCGWPKLSKWGEGV